jgi:hypothetical protein
LDGGKKPEQCAEEFAGDLHGEVLDGAANGELGGRRNLWRRRPGSWERVEELPFEGLLLLELMEAPATEVKQPVEAAVAALLLRQLCEETEREERDCIVMWDSYP